MPYQNNNNRIVPEAKEDRNLKPAATPLDKSIKYNIDTSEGAKWMNTANALASLGKGLMDMDTLWHFQSQENAIKAIQETENAGGNKKQWREVSKKIKGAGIFNPYNDNAYREIQAQEIYRAAALEITSTPELEKLDPEKFNQLIHDVNSKMIEAFKETGLTPKDYGASLVQFHNQMEDLTAKYTIENKKYKFEQLSIKEVSDIAFQLTAGLMDAEQGTETAMFRQILENKIAHLTSDTGIVAPDTQAKILLEGVKNYIAKNTNQLDDAEILAAISDLKLGDGTSLNEVVPNYNVTIKELCVQAREANFRQMKMESEIKDFQQEQKIKEVMTDFMKRYTNGELKSPDAMQVYAKEMMNKYGLDGINSMKLFHEFASGRKTWVDLAEVETDPRVAAQLGMKIIDGTASFSDITNAINNGTLNYKEGFQMLQNLQVREQKEQSAEEKKVQSHIKAANKEMLEGYHTGDTDISAIIIDPDGQASFQNALKQLENKYQQDHDYQAFNNDLARLKSAYKQYSKEKSQTNGLKTGFMAGASTLRSTPAINQAQWKQSIQDLNKSINALKQMGIVRNKIGFKDSQIGVASAPQKSRKITVTNSKGKTYTQTARHTGYDLSGKNVIMGKPVYSPMEGVVVGVLREHESGGMGNMVLIQCKNGKYIKYMHLQQADLPNLGTKVKTNTPIGHIGNTGNVGSKKVGSLHVEFYDANKKWITANQFLNE